MWPETKTDIFDDADRVSEGCVLLLLMLLLPLPPRSLRHLLRWWRQ
jgi:hypothetical protein